MRTPFSIYLATTLLSTSLVFSAETDNPDQDPDISLGMMVETNPNSRANSQSFLDPYAFEHKHSDQNLDGQDANFTLDHKDSESFLRYEDDQLVAELFQSGSSCSRYFLEPTDNDGENADAFLEGQIVESVAKGIVTNKTESNPDAPSEQKTKKRKRNTGLNAEVAILYDALTIAPKDKKRNPLHSKVEEQKPAKKKAKRTSELDQLKDALSARFQPSDSRRNSGK